MTSEQIVVVFFNIFFIFGTNNCACVYKHAQSKAVDKKKKTKINLFVITACLNNKISKQRLYFSSV